MYQQTRLSDTSAIGAPGPLPDVIATWGDAPDLLADLTGHVDPQFGFDGTGFWPVIVVAPNYDASSQILVQPTVCASADAQKEVWSATATVRDMTPAEYLVAHPVPASVSNYQARTLLIQQGLFAKVDADLKGADQTVIQNQIALQAWEYANDFDRASEFVTAMQQSLSLSDAQVNAMFVAAAAIR